MANTDKKHNDPIFKKRAHRSWNTALLEDTIEDATIELTEDLFEFNIDLDIETTEDLDSFYPELNFNDDQEKVSQIEAGAILPEHMPASAPYQRHSQILLGGFFQTQPMAGNNNAKGIHKPNAIVPRPNKIAQEKETVLVRRRAAEAKIVAQQFKLAMDQTTRATIAHQKETELRNHAEQQIKQLQLRANNAELELQNERLLRIDDHKQIKCLKQQLENDLAQYASEIGKLEKTTKELSQQALSDRQLKDIIATEQKLRKIAEQQIHDLTQRIEIAESGWQSEIKQRQNIEEHAKKAAAHANSTIMHLLNAPSEPTIVEPCIYNEDDLIF